MTSGPRLEGRRFAVRFLGRPGAWAWLAGTLVPALAAWYLMALPARGAPAEQRIWFLWSGNVLLVMFLATLLFSARKWSIKLRRFRDRGRASPDVADQCWAEIQAMNRRIRNGAYGGEEEILEAADAILQRFGVDRSQRAEVRTIDTGGGPVRYVQLVKLEPLGRLEPWLEMHMGLGTVACLGVWLHADFMLWHHVGWVLVVLSSVVLVTGIVGALFYRLLPPALAAADPGIPYEEANVARETYDECIAGVLGTLDGDLRAELRPLLRSVGSAERIEARSRVLLSGAARGSPQQAALIRDLVVMAGSRDRLRLTTARARRIDFWLRVWRYVHVPASVAIFFAIAVHVIQVVWY